MLQRWYGMIKTKLGKLHLDNPVTVASGTFGKEFGDLIDLNRLGAIVTKTITMEPKAGNPTPRLYETEAGLLNSIGLQNPGLKSFMQDVLPEYEKIDSPLLVSFSGSTTDEFCKMVEEMESSDVIKGYEVNVSCPNVENEGIAFGTDPEVVNKLTKALSERTDKELIIKLTPNVTNIMEIAKAAEEGGADSLALINTLLGMAIDWETGKTRIARGISGYSGIAIKPVALQNVYRVHKAVNIPILAMGGIFNWQDAMEFFYAGASAIAVGTANFVNPEATISIIDSLTRYFDKNDIILENVIGKVSGIRS